MAIAFQYGFWEQFAVTGIGGVFGTTFFTYFGEAVKRRVRSYRNRRKSAVAATPAPVNAPNQPPKNTFTRRIWNAFGLPGLAFLTPPVLSPPLGVALALGFGAQRSQVVVYMGVSMLMWAGVFAALGTQILAWLQQVGLVGA
jgi:hypothetical protein